MINVRTFHLLGLVSIWVEIIIYCSFIGILYEVLIDGLNMGLLSCLKSVFAEGEVGGLLLQFDDGLGLLVLGEFSTEGAGELAPQEEGSLL